jgi:xylulokinase
MSRCWLGLDFGTSSVKALLVGDDGTVVGRASVAYSTTLGPGGAAEQDPAGYLAAARDAIRASGAAAAELRGVGLAGQTPTLVLVGEDGEAVRPALTWQDHRASSEARLLEYELGGADELFGTRVPWTAAYPPAKLLWLAAHEPQTVARTRFVLQPKDYVGLQLTGSPLSDPWSSKGLRHVGTFAPVEELLGRVGFPAEVAPPVADAWTSRGVVTDGASRRFGLPSGVPVSVGWSDAVAAMLAVGAFEEPAAFILAGTSSIVGVTTSRPLPPHPRLLELPATCAPLAVHYGPTESSGASVEWVARLLGCEVPEALELASSAPVGPQGGPVFVPYLSGERAPVWRTDVRAVALGLGTEHGPADLARAVVEGVCLSEADVLAVAEDHAGTSPAAVTVAGRGASGPPWIDGRLSALGKPVRVLAEADVSALGAAMLGAAAAEGDLAASGGLRGELECFAPSETAAGPAATRLAAFRRAAAAAIAWSDAEVRSSEQ